MPEMHLTQPEANFLIKLEKHWASGEKPLDYPNLGGKLIVDLICINKRENFSLDITRSNIILKVTKQLRARQVFPLLRLDIGGSPHRNPDDTFIESPHLHIYREGFGDKWAYPIPQEFSDLTNIQQTLIDFMNYCNITKPPIIKMGLPFI